LNAVGIADGGLRPWLGKLCRHLRRLGHEFGLEHRERKAENRVWSRIRSGRALVTSRVVPSYTRVRQDDRLIICHLSNCLPAHSARST
jgi:hypothetical protein